MSITIEINEQTPLGENFSVAVVEGLAISTSFDGLADTPASKTANLYVRVNAAGDALEYVVIEDGEIAVDDTALTWLTGTALEDIIDDIDTTFDYALTMVGNTASRPVIPAGIPSATYYDTDVNQLFVWNGVEWVSAASLAQSDSERDFYVRRKQYDEVMAASGFVHFGKHRVATSNYKVVGQGMNTSNVDPNVLFMGREDSFAEGDSKTDIPVINMAGVISKIYRIGTTSTFLNAIKFPDAPDGTVTYDSATGAIVDFTTDVDPKYGDVAGTTNEAVARAFEGDVKNGDFRNGDNGDWTYAGHVVIGNGSVVFDSSGASNYSYIKQTILQAGVTYTIGLHVDRTLGLWQVFAAGELVTTNRSDSGYFEFTFTPSSSGEFEISRDSSGGAFEFTVSNVSVRPATNEVVTKRVDHFGLEGYLEEVTLTNPHVYPNGNIQSQAATMNGIATAATGRATTYYAVFDGDTTSAGLGVNYWAASDAEKAAMRADPDNNIYVGSDGKVYQFRIRQRTIAGAGNGDWLSVSTTVTTSEYLRSHGDSLAVSQCVKPQGIKDSVDSLDLPFNGGGLNYVPTNSFNDADKSDRFAGLFSLRDANTGNSVNFDSVAVNGECYWLPLGTVTRLNQGGFHPSFNPLGTASFYVASTTAGGRGAWYSDWTNPDFTEPTTKAECFDGRACVQGTVAPNGDIASGGTPRGDGRFYDAIYADGIGGVQQDLRLSAQGGTSSDILGTEDAKCRNGTQRGLQKLVFTTVGTGTVSGSANGNFAELPTSDNPYLGFTGSVLPNVPRDTVSSTSPSRYHYVYNATDGLIYPCHALVESGGITYVAQEGSWLKEENSRLDTVNLAGKTCYMVVIEETHLSVSGEFSQTDVIGDPANILATPDLANGWLGNWVPVIPDGVNTVFPAVRKVINEVGYVRTFTSDNGVTWGSQDGYHSSFDSVRNLHYNSPNLPSTDVIVVNYTAHTYITAPSNNSKVYKGTEGVGDVWVSSFDRVSYGSLLAESFIGDVLTNDTYPESRNKVPILGLVMTPEGKINAGSSNTPEHYPFNIIQPSNNSPAVKALTTVVEENGLLWLEYHVVEMVWDYTLDSGLEFTDRTGNSSETFTEGEYYHLTGGTHSGYWYCDIGFTGDVSDGNYSVINDKLIASDGSTRLIRWNGNGWGDDNTIPIVDGVTTDTDLNGNTRIIATHRCVEPIGAVRNEK